MEKTTAAVHVKTTGEEYNKTNPIKNSLRKLSPLFLLAGVYILDDRRNRFLNTLAKIHSLLVWLVCIILCCLFLVDTYLNSVCTSMILMRAYGIVFILYTMACNLIWKKIHKKIIENSCKLAHTYIAHGRAFIVRLERIVRFIRALLFIIYIVSSGMLVFLLVLTLNSEISNLEYFHRSFPEITLRVQIFMVLVIIFEHYAVFTVIISQSWFAIWCYILCQIFRNFNSKVSSGLSKTDSISVSVVEKLRLHYEFCLEIVRQSDDCFQLYIGITLVSITATLCLAIYIFFSSALHDLIDYFTCLVGVTVLIVTVVSASTLQKKVIILN